jgi:ornithine--oxo-acid transaminase
VSFGYGHPKLLAVFTEQAKRLAVTSRAFHSDKLPPFLAKLCEVTGMDRALPMSTGAEGVETAIKCVRKWAYVVKKVPAGRAEIIVCEGNFHGRTTTIVGFSSEPQYREGFGPFTPGFKIVPYGDAQAMAAAMGPDTAAVLVEPIQGEAGINVPPESYLRDLRDLCDYHRSLLVLDEIQTGFGRTGAMFDFLHSGIRPDAVTVGKALGGGALPVSAFLASEEVMSVFKPGDHGSTFGGNPLACAVARAAMSVLVDEELPERSAELGAWFMEQLRLLASPHVKEVRGRGLLIGVELHPEAGPARKYCLKLKELGVLCKDTHGQVMRLAPPLVVAKSSLDFALEQLAIVLA